ncbi:hypothetical protein EKK58_04990 [Candidatus Dependentiae bacterium]|nr:MAG: hypothetical protein EKK58_04990 [Candidatus Dependentiae bacterium]
MITLKKYMCFLTALFVVVVASISIDANPSITKRSIQNAKKYRQLLHRVGRQNNYIKQVAFVHPKKSARPVVLGANGFARKNVKLSHKAGMHMLINREQNKVVKNSEIPSEQVSSDMQESRTVTVGESTDQVDTNCLHEAKKSQDLSQSHIVENVDKKDDNAQKDLSQTSVISKEHNGNNDPLEGELNHNEDFESAFLQRLAALSPDQLDQELSQLNLNDEHKQQIKLALAKLPEALKGFVDNQKDLNNLSDKVMESKGWLEYFRSDILNYQWLKTGCSWARTAWDYTGGAFLQKCGIASPSTVKELTDYGAEGLYVFVNELVKMVGLSTPGEVLDKLLITALHTYFPQENTWSNMCAQATFAIAYYGAIRGMPQQEIIWKTMEAFLCTSYCKYFGKNNADCLRLSVFQPAINFFYYYIPNWFKNGKIEWLISNMRDVKTYKYITSIIGIANALAHITMNGVQQNKSSS